MADFDQRSGEPIGNWDSAMQSVEIMLFTRIGSAIMLRHFGAGVLEPLGRLATPRLFAVFRLLIAAAIDLWEPRLRVRRVSVGGSVEAIRLGQFHLAIEVDWRPNALFNDFSVADVRMFGLDFAQGRGRVS